MMSLGGNAAIFFFFFFCADCFILYHAFLFWLVLSSYRRFFLYFRLSCMFVSLHVCTWLLSIASPAVCLCCLFLLPSLFLPSLLSSSLLCLYPFLLFSLRICL